MDREDLIDLIESAIDNVHDMDVTLRDYAVAAEGALPSVCRAGPDLLAELTEMLALHEAHHNHPVHVAARAAIAKARGE